MGYIEYGICRPGRGFVSLSHHEISFVVVGSDFLCLHSGIPSVLNKDLRLKQQTGTEIFPLVFSWQSTGKRCSFMENMQKRTQINTILLVFFLHKIKKKLQPSKFSRNSFYCFEAIKKQTNNNLWAFYRHLNETDLSFSLFYLFNDFDARIHHYFRFEFLASRATISFSTAK